MDRTSYRTYLYNYSTAIVPVFCFPLTQLKNHYIAEKNTFPAAKKNGASHVKAV